PSVPLASAVSPCWEESPTPALPCSLPALLNSELTVLSTDGAELSVELPLASAGLPPEALAVEARVLSEAPIAVNDTSPPAWSEREVCALTPSLTSASASAAPTATFWPLASPLELVFSVACCVAERSEEHTSEL